MLDTVQWQVGDTVSFDATEMAYRDWIGTLRTCELPQVKVYDCVVRVHFVERVNDALVVAHGLVVSLQSAGTVKQVVEQISESIPKTKITFKEGAKERLIAERDEKRKRDKARPDYQSMIRSNIKGYSK